MNKKTLLYKPIIFIGTGRSGTTIISEIIMNHPDIAYISTYQNLVPHSPWISSLRHVFQNPLWKIQGGKKQLNKVHPLNKYVFRPTEGYQVWDRLSRQDFTRDFLENTLVEESQKKKIRSFFKKMLKAQGKSRLAFKITGPPKIKFLHQIFPDALFVNLQRDQIATVSSFLNVDFWEERGMHRLWWKGAYDPDEIEKFQQLHTPEEKTAFQIAKLYQQTQKEAQETGADYMEISYEEFVKEPEKAIDKIISAAELDEFDYKDTLEQNPVKNRNKMAEEYFEPEILARIRQILAED